VAAGRPGPGDATPGDIDGQYLRWTAAPEPPIRYRLGDRLADARWGRRDGRAGLPELPPKVAPTGPPTGAGAAGDAAAGGGAPAGWETAAVRDDAVSGADAGGAADADGGGAFGGSAVPRVGTPRLEELRRIARDRIAAEWLQAATDIAPAARPRSAASSRLAQAAELAESLWLRCEEAAKQLTEAELTERHQAELMHPEALVRARRRAARERRRAAAEAEYTAARREAESARQQVAAFDDLVARRWQVARIRAQRIHEHAWRRVAAYWRQLVRAHPDGPWLNGRIELVGPDLPEWAHDPNVPGADRRGSGAHDPDQSGEPAG
jgi:hypothetical protein